MNQYQFSNSLLTTIKSFKNSQAFNSWIYKGKTNIAYGSPNGGWDGMDGYLFEKEDKSYSYIIRSIPNQKGSCYIVIESINIRGQLYNMDLNNPRTFIEHFGKTNLLESYRMTAGKGKKKEIDVKNAFKSIGILTNKISITDDIQPDWIKTITDILEWGILREKVKLLLKNKVESTSNGITKHDENKMPNQPLNQILYGPPGTGKTYATKEMAVSIINTNFIKNLDKNLSEVKRRKAISDKYKELFKLGQIVFTTFHQSMSYEDFIEGIKPVMRGEEEGGLSYEIQDGIFKAIGNKAQLQESDAVGNNFEECWNKLIELVRTEISTKKLLKIGSWDYGLSTRNSLKYSSLNSPSQYTFTITKQNVYDAYQNKKARPSGAFQKDMLDVVAYMKKELKLNDNPIINNLDENYNHNKQNYVIIIDEINRGNISQIFGELITLIEDDKRLGNDEAIEITLPYSKENFGVPSNLYIIGTMNTADRSVEALDTALRRRFSFTEVLPDSSLLEAKSVNGINLKKLLDTINNRIEILLNRDHTIGHSYFIKLDNDDVKGLRNTFKNNIIPLLQEYFYGDYEKIGMILGAGFVNKSEKNQVSFPNFIKNNDYNTSRYKLISIDDNFDIINALHQLWE